MSQIFWEKKERWTINKQKIEHSANLNLENEKSFINDRSHKIAYQGQCSHKNQQLQTLS